VKKVYCSKCKLFKQPSEFHKHSNRARGLQVYCKECSKQNSEKVYKGLSKKDKKKRKLAVKEKANRNRQFVWDYLKEHPCVDCNEKNVIVLEFDHLKNKEHNVSNMTSAGYSIKSLLKEISKCEVRCANCHRIKTAERFGYYKNIIK
jgi:hypothetical protein